MPTQADTDETTKFLARWVNTQKVNYKKTRKFLIWQWK